MNMRPQRIGTWLGPIGINLFGLPLLWPARLLPLPSPSLAPEPAADLFRNNRVGVCVAAILLLWCVSCIGAFFGVISAQMRRMVTERTTPVWSYIQLTGGLISVIPLICVSVLWMVLCFRTDRSIETFRLLYDMVFLFFVVVAPPATIQAFAIGCAILADHQPEPVYPRWLAFVNFWTGVLYIPGSLACFFHSGPFAWNGIIAFYLPLVAAGTWYYTMAWAMLKADKRALQSEAVSTRADLPANAQTAS